MTKIDTTIAPDLAALVLLSGGLDSVAALHWAIEKFGPGHVHAIAFDYAQPHRDQELGASQTIAARLGIPWTRAILPEIGGLNPAAGRRTPHGVHNAFVPGRNGLFLWRAANHAARTWPDGRCALVMGATLDDFAAFPDCRTSWFEHMKMALYSGLSGLIDISLRTPWVGMSKVDVLRWAAERPDALRDVTDSVSCYRGTRCGACDPCALRAAAFREVGLDDGGFTTALCGGDPAREADFK